MGTQSTWAGPTAEPTRTPSVKPTESPSVDPTSQPTESPTSEPTFELMTRPDIFTDDNIDNIPTSTPSSNPTESDILAAIQVNRMETTSDNNDAYHVETTEKDNEINSIFVSNTEDGLFQTIFYGTVVVLICICFLCLIVIILILKRRRRKRSNNANNGEKTTPM